ncbi:MAG: hypothetical protein AAF004_13990 [Pseudomonadota bacterium]
MADAEPTMIGGDHCYQPLAPSLLPTNPRPLAENEIESLWRIFAAIGDAWQNTRNHSIGLRSTWLEFVNQRATTRPSYVIEYTNATVVLDELIALYGEQDAFHKLFFANNIPDGPPVTALAHAKHYVVNEFMSVQVVAGGFRDFIAPSAPDTQAAFSINHRAYIAGSRYGRLPPVRVYKGKKT